MSKESRKSIHILAAVFAIFVVGCDSGIFPSVLNAVLSVLSSDAPLEQVNSHSVPGVGHDTQTPGISSLLPVSGGAGHTAPSSGSNPFFGQTASLPTGSGFRPPQVAPSNSFFNPGAGFPSGGRPVVDNGFQQGSGGVRQPFINDSGPPSRSNGLGDSGFDLSSGVGNSFQPDSGFSPTPSSRDNVSDRGSGFDGISSGIDAGGGDTGTSPPEPSIAPDSQTVDGCDSPPC